MENEEIVMEDGTVIRMSDLTFDDVVIPHKEEKAIEGEIIRKKPKREKSPLYK